MLEKIGSPRQVGLADLLPRDHLRIWGVSVGPDGSLHFTWPTTNGSSAIHIKKSNGGWSWVGSPKSRLPFKRRLPFGLDKLSPETRELFIVESETDLLVLDFLGFSGIATGGANGWNALWWNNLPAGASVVVWVEDEAGLALLRSALAGAPEGRKVKVFSSLGLPGKDARRIWEKAERDKDEALGLIRERLSICHEIRPVDTREGLLEEIRAHLGKVSRSGSGYRSLCPFHDDTNPSFDVGLKGFKCWSTECGVQGSLELLGAHYGLLLRENRSENSPKPRPEPLIVSLADVTPEDVAWLWEPYIPRSKVTILEGDPGVGKTSLALTIAAIVSRGWPFPGEEGIPKGQREPANVLYLSAEDGLADTLRPRLDAADADVTRVSALTGWKCADPKTGKEETKAITLAQLPVIEEALERVRPDLVIVDPIQAYLGAGVDMHRANEVRPILAGLAALAERYRCAVLCIRHLGKTPQDRAVYRGLGSIDFAAAARSILLVGQDPQDEGKRVLAQVKNSLAPLGTSLRFVFHDGRLLWCGASQVTAEALLAPPRSDEEKSALEEACEFLSEALSNGPRPVDEVFKEARKLGIVEKTLRRAKDRTGARAYRQGGSGKRGGGTWYWGLGGQATNGKEGSPIRAHVGHLNHNTQVVDIQGFSGKDLDGQMTILKNDPKHQQLQIVSAQDLDGQTEPLGGKDLGRQHGNVNPGVQEDEDPRYWESLLDEISSSDLKGDEIESWEA